LQFAVVNNERVPAEPKLKGLCPKCLQPVTAKCGTRRMWHWAHHTERSCDVWWEQETEWHRAWKNKFPIEWQESVKHDEQSGEKHIADVRTGHDLVIEFQHSPIDPQERSVREHFYGNMVWVVDGTRLKKDYTRFLNAKSTFMTEVKQGVFLLDFPKKCFPAEWLESSVPVFFDFRGVAPTDTPDRACEPLWCLLPGRAEGHAVVIEITYTGFVTRSSSRTQLLAVHEIVSALAEHIRQQRGKDIEEAVRESVMKMDLLRRMTHKF
jgi:competence protein CoiA